MGVTDLWKIVSTQIVTKSLEDLRGQTVAVDLSQWIMECENSAWKHTMQKAHIRNLFCRVTSLLKHGIIPIFVLDGETPDLKKRGKGRLAGTPVRTVKECCRLLTCIGLESLQSPGEAEATMAHLNSKDIVDACLTDDSDSFLFGAKIVYTKFSSMERTADNVSVFKSSSIQSSLNLTREKLVALALFVGCDFTDGVKGIGKEKFLKWLKSIDDNEDVLERLRGWKTAPEPSVIGEFLKLKKKSHCGECSHLAGFTGSTKQHLKNGCADCLNNVCSKLCKERSCSCDWHRLKDLTESILLESKLRSAAINQYPDFPDEKVIDIFLRPKVVEKAEKPTWMKPNYNALKNFLTDHLDWTIEEATSKILPLITLWYLRNNDKESLKPSRIVKSRQQYFQSKLEIVWEKIEGIDIESPTTLERFEDIECTFPELVEHFLAAKRGKKNTKRGKKKDVLQRKITDSFKIVKNPHHFCSKGRESLRRSVSLEDIRVIKSPIGEQLTEDVIEEEKDSQSHIKQEKTPFPVKYESDDSLPSLTKFIRRKVDKHRKPKLADKEKPKFIMSSSESNSEDEISEKKSCTQFSLNFSLDSSF
ncbi:DgyrCDS12946 [Dimorphilus gyrociliatus]|uniref:DgyrCDS12946 n=1 Tax=Dimorphilus gyrociliatus TaxID=2664684 RepID=A0A7I8W972_9ANNE|nr:DgyrCDS12946 [Dimorphilus gyrociliatus]